MLHIDFEVHAERLKDADISNKQLRVIIAATHTDMPINNRIYTKNEVKQQIQSWTKPYNVPILVHHNESADAVGRVQEQFYVDQTNVQSVQRQLGLNPQQILPAEASGVVLVVGYVTDEVQIQKILAGIYKTVSVGFTCDDLICSVCGKHMCVYGGCDEEDPNRCTHIPGEEYDGITAYQIPVGIRYQEVSFVNVPADQYAGIVDFELVPLEEAQKHIGVDVEKTQDANVNSSLQDKVQGGIVVEELDRMKAEHEELLRKYEDTVNQLQQLQDAYNKLQEAYNELNARLKDSLVDKVVFLKSIILNVADDESLKALKDHYSNYSIDMLAMLEKEFLTIVEALLDCEECDEEEEKPEEPKEEVAPTQADAPKDEVKEVVKDENPQKLQMVDVNKVLNKILGK